MTLPLAPTTRGKVMIVATLASLGVALVNVNLTTGLVGAGFCGILVSSLFLSFFSLRKITVERSPSKDGTAGASVSLPLVVANKTKRHRQAVVVMEQSPFAEDPVASTAIPSLKPMEKRLVARSILAIKRGLYKLDQVTLAGGDPAGLFARKKVFSLPSEVMIYPGSVRLSHMPLRTRGQTQFSITGRPLGVAGMGQEFFGIREYKPSDGVRFIHWKSSAKHRKLLVKEFESHSSTRVTILLDVEKKNVGQDQVDNNFEYLIKTVSSMVNYLSTMYCQIFFVTAYGSDNELFRIDGETFSVKDNIMETLAALEPREYPVAAMLDEEIERLWPKSIFYCLTMSEPENMDRRLDFLSEKGIDTRWILAPSRYFPPMSILASTAAAPKTEPVPARDTGRTQAPFVARRGLSIAQMLSYG